MDEIFLGLSCINWRTNWRASNLASSDGNQRKDLFASTLQHFDDCDNFWFSIDPFRIIFEIFSHLHTLSLESMFNIPFDCEIVLFLFTFETLFERFKDSIKLGEEKLRARFITILPTSVKIIISLEIIFLNGYIRT